MPAVISVASGKGGVGKTTSVANLAVALGQQGLNVLAWDLDGQGNLGQAFGVEIAKVKLSSYHLMSGRITHMASAVVSTDYERVSLIPAHMELFAAEQELSGSVGKEYIVRTLLQQPEAQLYDVVLIDLPPNLGFHTVNGFAASRWVLIPLQVSGFALSGLRQLAHAIRLAQEHLNPELEMLGLLPTFVSARTNFSRELVEALHLLPDTRVFQPYIPYTVRVAEGSLTGIPVVATAGATPAAAAYSEVAQSIWEVIRAAPEHVTRAPAPAIAPPPRAQLVAVNELVAELRAQVEPLPPPRRGFFSWFRRIQRSPS
jgi:chromosome partitioning protein